MVRFDSLDKKPKIWYLGEAAIPVIAAVAWLVHFDRPDLYGITAGLIGAYLLFAAVSLFRAARGQLRYNPYSYNTIYYIGFFIFTLLVLVIHCMDSWRLLSNPDLYSSRSLLDGLESSASTYMILSLPFAVIVSIMLAVSNIILLRKEGRNLTNLLGIILAVLLVGGILVYWRANYYATGSYEEVRRHDVFVNAYTAVYLYFESMLIGAGVADVIAARYEPAKNKDFIIILGCGLRPDGTPTPLLQGRCDRALKFYHDQLKETGKKAKFITSGGKGSDEVVAESTSMKNYLISQGIAAEDIIEENRSTDTFENMKYSKEIIDRINPDAKVVFSTTKYHVFRSGLQARRNGLKAVGIGSPTKWYFWPNAAVREFVGLLTEHRGKQAVVLSCMVIFYVAATYYVYMYK